MSSSPEPDSSPDSNPDPSSRSGRPASAPDFLLSRGDGSVRTQGARGTFTDAWEAVEAIEHAAVAR